MKKDKGRGNERSTGALIVRILSVILLIGVIAMCVPLTVPRLLGYQIYTVISGSMEPEIPLGSLVYVAEVDPETVMEGDVIAFYGGSNNGAIITHRVVYNQTVVKSFVTKGDANDTEDIIPVEYNRLIGVVTKTIPKLGSVMTVFTETRGKLFAAGLLAISVLLNVLAGEMQKEKEKKNREKE